MLFHLETWSSVPPDFHCSSSFFGEMITICQIPFVYTTFNRENLAFEIPTLNVTSEKNVRHVIMFYVCLYTIFYVYLCCATLLCLNQALHVWTVRELHEGMHSGRQAFKILYCHTRIPALHPVCSWGNKSCWGKEIQSVGFTLMLMSGKDHQFGHMFSVTGTNFIFRICAHGHKFSIFKHM